MDSNVKLNGEEFEYPGEWKSQQSNGPNTENPND